MTVTASTLNNLYWDALIRTEDSTQVPGEGIAMHHRKDEVLVEGLSDATRYYFRCDVLEKRSAMLLSALKRMPDKIRQSISADGIPWILARRAKGILNESSEVTVERTLLMCMAVGLVSRTGKENEVCQMPYVTMDDVSLVRKEKLKDGKKRVILLRWFC